MEVGDLLRACELLDGMPYRRPDGIALPFLHDDLGKAGLQSRKLRGLELRQVRERADPVLDQPLAHEGRCSRAPVRRARVGMARARVDAARSAAVGKVDPRTLL